MSFLIELLGGIALLLWGLRMVQTGVMRAYGTSLKRLAQRTEGKVFSAFISGVFVAGLLQSSTATALIAASFSGQGIISMASAFIIVLGADIGTAIAVLIASQKITEISPLLVFIGVFGFLSSSNSKHQNSFRAVIGLGVILLALSLISATATALSGFEDFMTVISVLESQPAFLMLFALLLTYAAHSSLAVVLLCTGFVSSGLIGLPGGLVIVLGANLGGALLPVVATWEGNKDSRVPVCSNLFIRGLAVFAIYPFVEQIIEQAPVLMGQTIIPLINNITELDAGVTPIQSVPALFHLSLNLVVAIVGLLSVQPIVRLVASFIPQQQSAQESLAEPKYLDFERSPKPAVALSCAKREALNMASITQNMLQSTWPVLRDNDHDLCEEVAKLDDSVDNLYIEIKLYLAKVMQKELTQQESQSALDILGFTTNMEHIGDIIDRSLMALARHKIEEQSQFSEQGMLEISRLHEMVNANLELAINTFLSGDDQLAHQLFETKTNMRKLVEQSITTHLQRIGEGVPESLVTSSFHVDVLRDLRRINSHLSSIAYPILIAAGEVPSTKWMQEKSVKA